MLGGGARCWVSPPAAGFEGRDPVKVLNFKYRNMHSDAFLAPKIGTSTVRKLARKQAMGISSNTGGGH